MPSFGVQTPLTHDHFVEFEKACGKKSDGTGKRTDQEAEGRFRCFNRAELTKRGENLDINWLKDENASSHDELPEPDIIATMIRERLATVMEENGRFGGTPRNVAWDHCPELLTRKF